MKQEVVDILERTMDELSNVQEPIITKNDSVIFLSHNDDTNDSYLTICGSPTSITATLLSSMQKDRRFRACVLLAGDVWKDIYNHQSQHEVKVTPNPAKS